MKRILITGANSYIGTSVEKYLSQWPEEYHVDTIDMVDGSWRTKSFEGYDSVFHVAGIAHINTKKLDREAQERYWAVNAELPVEVAEKAKTEGVRQFVFLSSMSVYGEIGSLRHPVVVTNKTKPNPKDIYGESKLAAEDSLRKLRVANFAVAIMRPPMIYGPDCKGNYRLLIEGVRRMPLFPEVWNQRSMLSIDTLNSAVRFLVDTGESGLFFPQDAKYVCTSQMARDIASKIGKKVHFTRALNPLLRLLSGKIRLVDKVFGNLTYAEDTRMNLHSTITIDGMDQSHESDKPQ